MKKITVAVFVLVLGMLSAFLGPTYTIAVEPEYSIAGIGKVLVKGASTHGANGIMFDGNNLLHIASFAGNEIIVMNPKSGSILERVAASGPDDLTFGPDGSLYYTSIVTGYVSRIAPDGTITSQFVALGVNPITFSTDGRLFVACDFLGDGIYELDPNLINPPVQIAGAPVTPFLGYLNGMDFGPDGLLYAPVWTQGRVVSIDVDAVTFPMTTVCDSLGIPAAVKFDSQGRLYVGDQLKGEILRVNVESGDKEVIATGLFGLDNLAFDSSDQLYASNADDGSIYEVLNSGETRVVSKGGMIAPAGVAVMSDSKISEFVFVADGWSLREFDGLTGKTQSVELNFIGLPSSIVAPMTVSVDDETLILSSFLSSGIQVWNPQTRTGSFVKNYLDLSTIPLNAIKFENQIIIAEFDTSLSSGRVIQASDGNPLARVLGVPMGLVAIGDDLYVADWALGMVLRIVTDGVPSMTPIAGGLAYPKGLAVDLNGDLLVVESGAGRVSRINLETGVISTVVEGLELGVVGSIFPWGNFNGIAVGTSGYIYVTGDTANVLYRLKPSE